MSATVHLLKEDGIEDTCLSYKLDTDCYRPVILNLCVGLNLFGVELSFHRGHIVIYCIAYQIFT